MYPAGRGVLPGPAEPLDHSVHVPGGDAEGWCRGASSRNSASGSPSRGWKTVAVEHSKRRSHSSVRGWATSQGPTTAEGIQHTDCPAAVPHSHRSGPTHSQASSPHAMVGPAGYCLICGAGARLWGLCCKGPAGAARQRGAGCIPSCRGYGACAQAGGCSGTCCWARSGRGSRLGAVDPWSRCGAILPPPDTCPKGGTQEARSSDDVWETMERMVRRQNGAGTVISPQHDPRFGEHSPQQRVDDACFRVERSTMRVRRVPYTVSLQTCVVPNGSTKA